MVINANELWHSLEYVWLSGVASQVVANTHQSYTVPVEVHACGILLFLYLSAQLSALDLIIYLSIISNFSISVLVTRLSTPGSPGKNGSFLVRSWKLSFAAVFLSLTDHHPWFFEDIWFTEKPVKFATVKEQWEFNQFTPQTSKFSFIRHANVLVFLGFAETVW